MPIKCGLVVWWSFDRSRGKWRVAPQNCPFRIAPLFCSSQIMSHDPTGRWGLTLAPIVLGGD